MKIFLKNMLLPMET